jgi:hypothetical protein
MSEFADKIAHPDSQPVSEDLERIEGHALAAIFQPVEVDPIQAGEFGKLVLGDSFFAADCPDSLPNEPVDVLQVSRLLAYNQ